MNVNLLTENHLEFLSLKGGCRGSSESTHVKMPYCWKYLATAHLYFPESYKGDDQTRQMHRLVWVFVVCMQTKIRFSKIISMVILILR